MNSWMPFWKFRIEKVENWLSQKAACGHHLTEINRWGLFRFKVGKPRTVTYGTGFNPVNGSPPLALLEEGWVPEVLHKDWYVISNSCPQEEIRLFPQGEQQRTSSRFSLQRFSFTLQVAISLILIPLWIIAALSQWGLIEGELPLWMLLMLFILTTLYILAVITLSLISRRKDKLVLEMRPPEHFIIKRRFGWTTSPDRLEQWLEAMEGKGYQLHQVQGNKFFYTKGQGRRVKYCVDYQLMTDHKYYNHHTEAGWTPIYTGHNHYGSWTIWARNIRTAQPPPLNDKKSQRKSALQTAIAISLTAGIYLPWILALAKPEIDTLVKHGTQYLSLGLLSLYGFVLLLTLWHTVRAWLYYQRLGK